MFRSPAAVFSDVLMSWFVIVPVWGALTASWAIEARRDVPLHALLGRAGSSGGQSAPPFGARVPLGERSVRQNKLEPYDRQAEGMRKTRP